jgi:hypothetical protein
MRWLLSSMSRQDVYYVMVHLMAFALAYSTAMATLIHANPSFTGWFDWGCLSQGLIGMGVTNLGSNIVNSTTGLSATHVLLQAKDVVKEDHESK